jgi:hypothetical protein
MTMMTKLAFAVALLGSAPMAQAATLNIGPVRGEAHGKEGTIGNTVLTYNLGADAHVTNIAYSLTLTALVPSWRWDHVIRFGGSSSYDVQFQPAYDLEQPGTNTFVGTIDLSALGADFFLMGDGVFKLEFLDSFETRGLTAVWDDVRFDVTYQPGMGAVPEPAAWALMIVGVGAIGGRMRRRPRTTVSFA